MILTYKYRIKDRSARKTLRRHAYAVNQVWNYCVAYQRDIQDRHRAGAPKRAWPSHFDLCYLTAGTSKQFGIHARTINEICRQFVTSRKKAKRAPRFRSSGGSKRVLGWIPFLQNSRQIVGNAIVYLGKRYRFWEGGRPVPNSAKGGCFVEDARGRWYVCFHVEIADEFRVGNGAIGIDLGIETLATCSNGAVINAARHYRAHQTALATAQRAGNKRRAKAIHAKIANSRRDHLHKATTKIARENELIAVGDVNVGGLTIRRLRKHALDAGWSMFRSQLEYKASRHRAEFVIVDERFTSQVCSDCGAVRGPKGIAGLGIRRWECSDCGAVHDRDVNAAVNILNVALSAQRRGDESRGIAQ